MWGCSDARRSMLEHSMEVLEHGIVFMTEFISTRVRTVLEHVWHATLLVSCDFCNNLFIKCLSLYSLWHATTVQSFTGRCSKGPFMWHATQACAFWIKENLPLVPLSVQRTETSIFRGGCSADTFCLPVEAGLTATAHLELPYE